MKKIIHEDERIIEILAMFANEVKTCRVSEGEAIDKAACMLTAYMEGMVKAECSPIEIDPMLEELAGALQWISEDGHAMASMTIGSRNRLLAALQKYQQPKVQP